MQWLSHRRVIFHRARPPVAPVSRDQIAVEVLSFREMSSEQRCVASIAVATRE